MSDSRDLAAQAFRLMQQALRESEARIRALEARLQRREAPQGSPEAQIATLTDRLEVIEAECARWRREAAQLEEVLESERAKSQQLKQRLSVAESGPEKLTRKEINYWRSKAESFVAEAQAFRERINSLRGEVHARENDLTLALARAEAAESERQNLAARNDALTKELSGLRTQQQAAETQLQAAQARVTELQTEVAEEHEQVGNLTQLSNERRERITRLEEQVEEAQERFEDARWRLHKAAHFERLVRRRKQLIRQLMDALRARQKANVALKAGVDSLRKYKATAEQQQHKLLAQIDHLRAEIEDLRTTREAASASPGSDEAPTTTTTESESEIVPDDTGSAVLEQRVNTQAQLIESLEAELKAVRLQLREQSEATETAERLRNELDMRNQAIAQLQEDADERERKLARLRGSESETLRLKTQVARLEQTLDTWKQRYEFLSAEMPEPLRATAEK